MHERLLRFSLAGILVAAITGVILLIARASGSWLTRNSDNLWHIAKLTVPFALLIALAAASWPRTNENSSAKRFVALVAVAVALGCSYWYFIGHAVGLGFASLAVEALACWVAAATGALLLALIRRSYVSLGTTLFICALGVLLPAPLFNLVTRNQTLTVAIVVPDGLANVSAQPKELGFDSQSAVEQSTTRVLQKIRTAGLEGNYRIVHLSRQGTGKESLAILILDAPITGRTLLPEPDATEVIYVQKGQEWKRIPAQASTLRRDIEMWGADDKDSLAYFGIPDATGLSLVGRVRTR